MKLSIVLLAACSNILHVLFREAVAAALKKLAVTILQKSNERNWRWLQVLPLFHFVSHLNTPFKPIPLNAEIECNFWKELESSRKKQTQAR